MTTTPPEDLELLISRIHDRCEWELADGEVCYMWQRGVDKDGYGNITLTKAGKQKQYKPHRLMLANKLGRPIRDGHHALHLCDHPRCQRPEHLYEGTQRDNMRDRKRAGRFGGEWHAAESKAERLAGVQTWRDKRDA